MKKIVFAIAIVLTFGLTANAQGRDGFFNDWDNNSNRSIDDGVFPAVLGGTLGDWEGDQNGAPLGTGLLILTALGAGYAVARKKRQ